jgi:hypothetical protein
MTGINNIMAVTIIRRKYGILNTSSAYMASRLFLTVNAVTVLFQEEWKYTFYVKRARLYFMWPIETKLPS